jgi:hypothetical protein
MKNNCLDLPGFPSKSGALNPAAGFQLLALINAHGNKDWCFSAILPFERSLSATRNAVSQAHPIEE